MIEVSYFETAYHSSFYIGQIDNPDGQDSVKILRKPLERSKYLLVSDSDKRRVALGDLEGGIRSGLVQKTEANESDLQPILRAINNLGENETSEELDRAAQKLKFLFD